MIDPEYSLRYYIETNGLYSINKIRTDILKISFTSAFSVLELVSNISEVNFLKRRNILDKVIKSNLMIDWQFPQKLLVDSYDFFKEFEFVDHRKTHLQNLLEVILNSNDYSEFIKQNARLTHGYEFFNKMDSDFGTGFINASKDGILKLTHAMQNSSDVPDLEFRGKKYNLSTYTGLGEFLFTQDAVNNSYTILSLAKMLLGSSKNVLEQNEINEQLIYKSYNSYTDVFVECFSKFCAKKFVRRELPASNDFADFTHLLYLRNMYEWSIISDDKIYNDMVIKRLSTSEVA